MERVVRHLSMALAIVGGAAMIAMMLHIVLDVAMKYVYRPLPAAPEIVSAYYMVALVFLPFAYIAISGGHIAVDVFTRWLKGYPLRFLLGLAGSATIVYLAYLIYHTTIEAMARTAEGEVWEAALALIPVWPSRWLLPIGFGVFGLYVVFEVIRNFLDQPAPDYGSDLGKDEF